MHPLTTSLAEIRSFRPCSEGWCNILAYRNSLAIAAGLQEAPTEETFPLVSCLESNSIADVLWLIGKRKAEIQIAVRFARMCADSVAHWNNKWVANANADATDATDAANAAALADANAAADAANAALAAAFADAAADATALAAADAAAADAAYKTQKEKNKQFLVQCINEFTLPTMPAPAI